MELNSQTITSCVYPYPQPPTSVCPGCGRRRDCGVCNRPYPYYPPYYPNYYPPNWYGNPYYQTTYVPGTAI